MRTPGKLILWVALAALFSAGFVLRASEVVNDVTLLHPVVVDRVIRPRTIGDIVRAVKHSTGPISIGGARHSQGGQIAQENSLHFDMTSFNKVVAFDPVEKTITVQSGITWRDIQDMIDPADLSVSIMQSYASFTVGGSLSVNCHGRYVGAGPIISSVQSIKIVLADGRLIQTSPCSHPDIFYSAIGGYGGIGVIVEATLQLTDNARVARTTELMPLRQYRSFFLSKIRDSPTAVFHNADIYPPAYDSVRVVTWSATDKPVTIKSRLRPRTASSWGDRAKISFLAAAPLGLGKWARQYLVDPLNGLAHPVEWRNYEASFDVAELEPGSREKSTDVLQEYFVPVERFDDFYPKLRTILREQHVNVLNISVRHARKDPGSLLAWAKTEVFAFVIYYRQGTTEPAKRAVGIWTRKLIGAALSVNGSYYLPYQIWADRAQFRRAYPAAARFLAIKHRVDPQNRFRNKLWDAYDPALVK